MRGAALAFCIGLIASPALSLSCLRPDVARSYAQAAKAEEIYVVVHGKLSFDGSKLPQTDWQNRQNRPRDTMIPARLTGHSLSRAGFETPFNRAITLNARCLGPWCGGATSGTDYLAFLRRTDNGYVLELDPCGGNGFANPDKAALDKVLQCHRGARCTPDTDG